MDNFMDGESAGAGVIDDLRDRVERDVVHVLSDMAFGERCAVGDRRGEEIAEDPEAFRVEIALGLRLDRKDRLRPLDEEVDFRIAAFRGPVAGRGTASDKLLHDVLLGQCAFEVRENGAAFEDGLRRKVAHGGEQTDIVHEQLERREVLVRHERHAW